MTNFTGEVRTLWDAFRDRAEDLGWRGRFHYYRLGEHTWAIYSDSTHQHAEPVIDGVARYDLRIDNRSLYDIYAAILKQEGLLDG